MNDEPYRTISQPETTSALARLVNLTCRVLGYFLLFIIFILIIVAPQEKKTALEVAFWLVVTGLVLLRFIDIKLFDNHTPDNKPATLKDWGQYSIGLILLAGFGFVIARAILMKIQ